MNPSSIIGGGAAHPAPASENAITSGRIVIVTFFTALLLRVMQGGITALLSMVI
jgi:hypothetical protein